MVAVAVGVHVDVDVPVVVDVIEGRLLVGIGDVELVVVGEGS